MFEFIKLNYYCTSRIILLFDFFVKPPKDFARRRRWIQQQFSHVELKHVDDVNIIDLDLDLDLDLSNC